MIIIALFLLGCVRIENQEMLPEAVVEETDLPEPTDAEMELPVFEKVFLTIGGRPARADLKAFSELADREAMEWSVEEGVAVVMERGRDGSFLYAVLTNENGFEEIAQLGYHFKGTDGEYEVMVDMTGSESSYLVDVRDMDSGTEVASMEMLKAYIFEALVGR